MKLSSYLHRLVGIYSDFPRFVKLIILSLPVLVFVFPIISSGNGVIPGDYDMQVQMTEAARKSIIEYRQFPLWNPWVAGGVPLFADPQFGLFTPQTLLSFVLGASYAWKITLSLYFFVGFFSMRALLISLTDKNEFVSVVLSYVWVFGSFFALRATGHFTFMLLTLLPLAVLLALRMGDSKKNRVYLMLLFAFSFNAAMHYSSILMLIAVVAFILLDLVSRVAIQHIEDRLSLVDSILFALKESLSFVRNMLFVCCGALLINLPKIYLGGKYLASNSVDRSGFYEPFIGLWTGIRSMALPFDSVQYEQLPFGLFEASSYIGGLTFILTALLTTYYLWVKIFKKDYLGILKSRVLTISVFIGATFLIGLGGYVYAGLRILPIFSSMRVSTRWLFLTSFGVVLLLSVVVDKTKQDYLFKRRLNVFLYPLLLLSLAQVFFVGLNLQKANWSKSSMINAYSEVDKNTDKVVDGEIDWQTNINSNYYALTQATVNNKSQLVADNALVDTTILGTIRCDQDDSGCGYILTNNAEVTYWSPNRMVLKRTGPGVIELNINPGKNWMVNGKAIYAKKTVSSADRFLIEDESKDITVNYSLF